MADDFKAVEFLTDASGVQPFDVELIEGSEEISGLYTFSVQLRSKQKDVKLEELVKKMNSATGSAKTEAIAELLTALVEDHRTMCGPMMANKMSMMNRMDGAGHDHEASAAPHK